MKKLKNLVAVVLSAAIMTMMSLTACAAFDNEAETTIPDTTLEETVVELTDQQKAVIEEWASVGYLYRFYSNSNNFPDEPTSANREGTTMNDIVGVLYSILNRAYDDSVIVAHIEHEEIPGYPLWYDKNSAYKNVGDLYGVKITDDDITAYNTSYPEHFTTRLVVDSDGISYSSADGEPIAKAFIDDYSIDGDTLIVSLPFYVISDVEDPIPCHATAIFTAYPDSFIGYQFESIALD